jgi:hypothetical protein
MTARKWILQTLLFTALAGGALVLVNVRLDIYGLYRDTHGRRLDLHDSERRGKYLLNHHYVPENFEAVLLGSSVTSNWNTGGLTASERPKLAICVVHPYMTDSHGLSADEMNRSEYWGALGSTSLLRAYKTWWSTVRHHEDPDWDAVGTELGQSPDGVKPLNPVLRRIMTSEGEVHIDPVAFGEYRAMVDELHALGVKVAAVVPPTSAALLEPHRTRLDGYVQRALTLFSPQDLVIDFNGPAYASFRADPANYRDGVHLTRRGAAELIRMLDQALLRPGAPPEPTPPRRTQPERRLLGERE